MRFMYLRHTTRHKDGKAHVYWQLVRSVRLGRKVRQETVAHLGELDTEGRARATVLARTISGRAFESLQGRLFEANAPVEAAAVRLDAVRLERSRSFGAAWLGWVLWHSLELDELLGGVVAARSGGGELGRCDCDSGDWPVVRALKRAARG